MNKIKTAVISAISVGALAGAMFASAQSATTATCFQFTQNMKLGTTGAEVLQLQKTLNTMGYTVSTTGVGSVGYESTYFGAKTKAAVVKYQAANNIINTGNVYTLTRAALNAKCVATPSTGTSTPTTSGAVSVSLASSQPNRVLISGTTVGETAAKLADIVFSGTGVVTNVKLQRIGISNTDTLTNVYLYDGNTRLTDAASVAIDGSISWNVPSGIFTVTGSKIISVRADLNKGQSGQSVGVSLTSYTVSGSAAAIVAGVNGPVLPIGSVDLATLTLSNQTSAAGTNLNLPQSGLNVWGSQVNVAQRAVTLKALSLKMVGSAPITSVANIKLVIDGVQEGNAVSVDSNSRVNFSMNKTLTTGSHNIEVRADIVSGSNRNFYFTLENQADLLATDNNFADVNATLLGYTSITKTGATQSIGYATSSTIVIEKAIDFSATNVATGTTNALIGKYRFAAYGEATKFQYITVVPTLASSTQYLTNVAIYVNGAQVGSSYTIKSGDSKEYSLGSNFIAQPGVSYTVEVKGDLVSTNGANVIGTVSVDLTNASGIGQESQNSFNIAPSETNVTITIGGGSPSIGKTIGAVNTSISANSSVTLGSFTIQGGSIEAVTVKQLTLKFSSSSTIDLRNISSIEVKDQDGNILGSTGIAQSSQSWTVNIPVDVGATKKVVITGTIGSTATGTTVIPVINVTYYNGSNQAYTSADAIGETLTVQSITVNTPTVSSKMSAQYVLGGTTSKVITYNVKATNGSAKIEELTFNVTGAGIQKLVIGSVEASVVGGKAVFSLSGNNSLSIPSGSTGLSIPLNVLFTPAYVGSGTGAASGEAVSVELASTKITDASGNKTNPSYTGLGSNTMTLVSALPTVAAVSSVGSLGVNASTSTNVKIGSITVKAGKGDIIVGKLSFNLNAPAAVSNVVVKVGGAIANDLAGNASTNTTTTATFAAGYSIPADTDPVTFDIYATVAPVTNSGSLSVTIGDGSNFKWSDNTSTTGTTYSGTGLSSTNYIQ